MNRRGLAGLVMATALSVVALLAMGGAALGATALPTMHTGTSNPQLAVTALPTMHTGTSNPQLPTNVCNQADFGFAVDVSGSIANNGETTSEKNGVKGFATAFQAAGGSGLYAGARFSKSSATDFTSGFVSSSAFTTAVDGLPNPNGGTPTGAGITAAAGNTANDRSTAPNVLFVVTDGSPNDNGNTSHVSTWVNAANAAIDAANAARATGWVVEAIYVGTPDSDLPFGTSGNLAWVQAVMTNIGGGSYTLIGDFNSLVNGLLISVGCPTASPSASASASSSASASASSTQSPFESFQGETATPRQTHTPPPTNSASSSSSGGATPLFALLICFLFGGIGLTAAQFQRRSIRR